MGREQGRTDRAEPTEPCAGMLVILPLRVEDFSYWDSSLSKPGISTQGSLKKTRTLVASCSTGYLFHSNSDSDLAACHVYARCTVRI